MKIHLIHAAFFGLTLSAFGALSARAQGTSAVTFPAPASSILTASRLTLGYEFTVATPMQATALGFYDYGANGLALSHPVGLWSNMFNLGTTTAVQLATATVTTGSPLQDSFRYVTLSTPIPLTPGVTYTLGAFTHPDGTAPVDTVFSQVANPSYASGFAFGRAVSSGVVDSLTVPTVDQNTLGSGFFGPGILLAPLVTVPEPSAWTVLLLGGVCAVFAVSRRRQAGRVQG